MASTKTYRERIKSIGNTRQITRAMEMIAGVKMQKAVKNIALARSYIHNAWHILKKVTFSALERDNILISPKKNGKTAVILITSDRGLCGSYNSEIMRRYLKLIKDTEIKNYDIIAIGKFGAKAISKNRSGNLISEFPGFENDFTFADILPIYKLTFNAYMAGKYERVVLVYCHFVSTLKQIPVVQQILPVSEQHLSEDNLWEQTDETDNINYKFEPHAADVLENVLKQTIKTEIYGAVLEANASEQSARMVAMKNATDNAQDLIDELKLIYNTVRQDSVTREISEITGAAEAMK